MKKFLSVLFCLFFLGIVGVFGCAPSFQQVGPSQAKLMDIPSKGTTHHAELGDTLVSKVYVSKLPCVKLNNTISATWLGISVGDRVPGEYDAYMQDSEWVYFAMKGSNTRLQSICLPRGPKTGLRVASFAKSAVYQLEPNIRPDFFFFEKDVYQSDSFMRELIYNGKSGDLLKFLYREISSGTMRFPFSQDIQYDLRDGNMIGFKGARLKVMNASNTNIEYELIENFR